MATKTSSLIQGLLSYGAKEEHSSTSKARTFVIPVIPQKFFVGRAGSCRYGRCYSHSTPVPRAIYRGLLKRGRRMIEEAHERTYSGAMRETYGRA